MTTHVLRRSYAVPVAPVTTLAFGALLLLLRAQASALDTGRVATLTTIYLCLTWLSVRARIPATTRGTTSPFAATLVGVVAVGAVVLAPWQSGKVSVAYGALAAALSVLAAIAEEAFFRRYAYAWLESWWGSTAAVLLSAAAFALIHVPLYGTAVLWVDVGAGVLFAWQRHAAGTWVPAAATHAFANLAVVMR
jgi:membrane protease YdiL (CAAX protease family)